MKSTGEYRFQLESNGAHRTAWAPANADRFAESRASGPQLQGGRARRSSDALEELEVPGGTSYLALGSNGRPELRLASGPVLVEETHTGGRPHLLLLALEPGALRLRLNGGPAPRAALLREGDRIALGGGPALRLTRRCAVTVGPASAEQAGLRCVVCRTAFREGGLVYCCPDCETLLHREGPETETERRLECSSLVGGNCPTCQRPIEVHAAPAASL